jgi:pyruvate/2-oxoglutarate dehydrogenase complex dihydrolipoamide dehydrogenase (E3) component
VDETVDAIVIGMGPGGEQLAENLAEAGLNVVGIEEQLVGGECPYFACVPTKMMVRASDLLADARRVDGMAGSATVRADWTPVAQRIRDDATDDWDDRVAVERFERKGGHFVRGTGRFDGPNRVVAGDRVFTAQRAIVINTGTRPLIPPIDGLDAVPYWTNRDAVRLTTPPESLVVLGGGPAACELAQVLSRFGSRVTIVELGEHLLSREEPEASCVVEDVFRREGITVHTAVSADRVRQRDGVIEVTLSDGTVVEGARLLVAVGRRTNLESLDLQKAELDPHAEFIAVDEHLRTATPGIWAIGDITAHGAFTHMSLYEADIATNDILGIDAPAADYRAVPRVTFTDPEVGSVGLTERMAREQGINVRIGIADVAKTTRGWIQKVGNDGVIKLVEDADRRVLVGATSVGPAGGEVLSMLLVAVHAEVPVPKLCTMITAYPTFHRGLEDALRDLKALSAPQSARDCLP